MQSLTAQLLAANRAGHRARAGELESKLAQVDPVALSNDQERLAFWINLYNAKVIEVFAERRRVGHLFRHRRVFSRASYRVGEDEFTLNVIEHGLLRMNSKPPYSLRRTLSAGDHRLNAAPSQLDPRVHFALNCAASSCPPVQAYDAEQIDEQLEQATSAYFQVESHFDRTTGKLTLPYLMKLYSSDFGGKSKHALWAAPYLTAEARARIVRAPEPGWDGWLEYGDYDWSIVT